MEQVKTKKLENADVYSDFFKQRLEAELLSIRDMESKKMNIHSVILDLLNELGFSKKEAGTIYLADVIEGLYHERKIFQTDSDLTYRFYNFDDEENNHYLFSDEYFEIKTTAIPLTLDDGLKSLLFFMRKVYNFSKLIFTTE